MDKKLSPLTCIEKAIERRKFLEIAFVHFRFDESHQHLTCQMFLRVTYWFELRVMHVFKQTT